MIGLPFVTWSLGAVIEGSTGITLDVVGPVGTTGNAVVNRLVLSVWLAGTDCDGDTIGRLGVGEITTGGVPSVAVAAPDFIDIGIGEAFEGCGSPKISEALGERVCLVREGPVGGEALVNEGTGAERPPDRSDGKAGFSELRSVCVVRGGSFTGNRSVTEGEGTEDDRSVAKDAGKGDALSVTEDTGDGDPLSEAKDAGDAGALPVTKDAGDEGALFV